MTKFNVILYDVNRKDFVPFDVIPYLVSEYKDTKGKPQTREEFKKFVKDKSMYMFWSRCEYEIILSDFPSQSKKEKIDAYYQIMMNIDVITDIIIKETKK